MPYFNAPVTYEPGLGFVARGIPVSGNGTALSYAGLLDASTIDLPSVNGPLVIALGALASKASPALTGVPTGPTAALGTNTTQLSTTAFVRAEIAALVNSAPSTLDTLDELAAAFGRDPSYAANVAVILASLQSQINAITGSAGQTYAVSDYFVTSSDYAK